MEDVTKHQRNGWSRDRRVRFPKNCLFMSTEDFRENVSQQSYRENYYSSPAVQLRVPMEDLPRFSARTLFVRHYKGYACALGTCYAVGRVSALHI
jgi:hypothetical protein